MNFKSCDHCSMVANVCGQRIVREFRPPQRISHHGRRKLLASQPDQGSVELIGILHRIDPSIAASSGDAPLEFSRSHPDESARNRGVVTITVRENRDSGHRSFSSPTRTAPVSLISRAPHGSGTQAASIRPTGHHPALLAVADFLDVVRIRLDPTPPSHNAGPKHPACSQAAAWRCACPSDPPACESPIPLTRR